MANSAMKYLYYKRPVAIRPKDQMTGHQDVHGAPLGPSPWPACSRWVGLVAPGADRAHGLRRVGLGFCHVVGLNLMQLRTLGLQLLIKLIGEN